MRKVIDTDPTTGISHVLYYDNDTDKASYVAEQDTSVLLDLNRKQANEQGKRYGEWTKVASLPMTLWVKLKQEGILDDAKAFKRWLNDPDNRYFKTHEGRV